MTDQVQTYANHRRLVPGFHLLTAALLLINFAFSVVHLWLHHTYGAVVGVLTAVALLLLFFFIRGFGTGNQDRIIRVEEMLRYERVLPGDLKGKAGQLTRRQVIGLRFAADSELPALVRRALDEKLSEGQIKKEVKTWRADHHRI